MHQDYRKIKNKDFSAEKKAGNVFFLSSELSADKVLTA